MPTSNIIYQNNLRTKATHEKSGQSFITDAPTDNNGKGEAFSPTDLTATSLGACAITVMGISSQKDNFVFDDTKIEVTKTMSADSPRRIIKIELAFQLKTSVALSKEMKEKYERIAYTCPVSKSLHPDIEQLMTFKWT